MIKVYNFGRGLRGVRVYWLCEEMGLPYEVETLPFPTPASYRALNPLGSVPFLEDEGEVAINESLAMLLYLAQRYGPTPLLPSGPALARVMQLTVLAEASIPLNPLMEAHFGAPEADKRNWSVRAMEGRAEAALAYVADLLGDQTFLAGPELTLADIAIATSLGMYRGALGKALSDPLVAYMDRIGERPAYQRARAKAQG